MATSLKYAIQNILSLWSTYWTMLTEASGIMPSNRKKNEIKDEAATLFLCQDCNEFGSVCPGNAITVPMGKKTL